MKRLTIAYQLRLRDRLAKYIHCKKIPVQKNAMVYVTYWVLSSISYAVVRLRRLK